MSAWFGAFLDRPVVIAAPAASGTGSAVTLTRRRLFILPTRAGWLLAAVLAALWLAALNYGNGQVYALAFLLVSVALVSILYTDRNLLGLRIQAGVAAPVFAGETARFALELIDTAAVARRALELEREGSCVARVDVPAGGRATVYLERPAVQRGWLDCPSFRLATRFPFGIFYCWSRPLVLSERALVYPRPAPRGEPSAARPAVADAQGRMVEAPRRGGGGDDFAGVRAYAAGDSPRHVHWKAVARAGRWLTKEFAEDRRRPRLVFDYDALEGCGGVEERLSLLCRFILDAEAAGLEYGLRLPGAGEIPPGHGPAHRHACLERLALFPAAGGGGAAP